jgi:glycosyltransferase involved in cell wall biosynthesis
MVRVSVVVPTHNRAERIERVLDARATQDIGEAFEVVVVDDASSDDTVSRLEARPATAAYTLIVLASAVNAGPARARNRGWRAGRGDRIAFIDDDCVPNPGWLRAITGALDLADIGVGRTKPPDDQLDQIGPFSNYLDLEHNCSFSTCNVAYRRDVLEKLGGFDESFRWPNGEDTELGLRALQAGFTDDYVPGALVWHDVSPSEFLAHLRRVSRLDGIVALIARHPEARAMVNADWTLRSVDKAVLLVWGAAAAMALAPRRETKAAAALAAGVYAWQFTRSHYRARSRRELMVSIPLGFVVDSWTVYVLARSSLRHRTLLL